MNQQPTFPEFVTEPATTTLGRLEQIPLLVAEALLTADAPNPGDRVRRTGKPGSKPPGNLTAAELLTTEHAGSATLVPLPRLVECSRIIWEHLDAELEAALGHPGEPHWVSECDWLRRAWPAAQAVLDQAALEWITDEVHAVWQDLANTVRLHRERVYRCPKCGDAMRLQDGGQWLLCDSGHTETADLERRYRRLPPMPARMVCDLLRVNPATLRQWNKRRKIAPVRTEGREHWYLPWDVLLAQHPDIAEAIHRIESVS